MAPHTKQSRAGRDDLLALFIALGVLGYLLLKNKFFFHDDAYISLRYAVNLAETGRLQWNPGEWVEGYTSLLHVCLSALAIRLGAAPELAVQIVNGCGALLLLGATWQGARQIAPGPEFRVARLLTLVAVAGSAPVAIWVLGGLETVLVAALLTLGLVFLLTNLSAPSRTSLWWAALAFCAAILTRLDSAAFITGAGIGLLLATDGRLWRRAMAVSLVVGLPALVAFAQMAVRLNVYGEYFPLTFYAKTDLAFSTRVTSGSFYMASGFAMIPTLIAALLTLLLARMKKLRSPATALLLPAMFLHLIFVFWAGGDHMPGKRMLVPLIAPAALYVLSVARSLAGPLRLAIIAIAPILAAVAALTVPPERIDTAAYVGERVGRHIAAQWPQGITIALNTAGSTPFFAREGRQFIDMLGLNDPVIAKREDVPIMTKYQAYAGHSKGDGAYVLKRAPERIIIGRSHGVDVQDAWFLSGVELADLPEFARCYEKVVEPLLFPEVARNRGLNVNGPDTFIHYKRVCP